VKNDPYFNQWEDFDDSPVSWHITEVRAVDLDFTPPFLSSFAMQAGLPCERARAAALCTGAKAAQARRVTVSWNATLRLHVVRFVFATSLTETALWCCFCAAHRAPVRCCRPLAHRCWRRSLLSIAVFSCSP